jgi:asparagine synthase (glutamine-hydrolysing)
MLDAMAHRGPDTLRLHQNGRFSAGVRSSTLSADRGDGFARDGETAVFLDGEVYNARAAGKSDAEVALHLYGQYGRAFPAHLEGVFACAVYDGGDLLLARDAVGVRPLYVGRAGDGGVCFASEMKALVGVAEEVSEMQPRTCRALRDGVSSYLPRSPEMKVPASLAEAAKALRRCVERAVARRLEDGAVGACLLSGGLDSSIIAAVARQLRDDLPALTVGMEGAPDLDSAALVAGHLDMEHHVRIYDARAVAEMVPRAVRTLESFDEDCVSGAIANLFASALARQHTNCILSGEGGDELFGGYHLLKDLPTDQERLKMMQQLIDVAYNTALQRLDRAMMANSINYRTPFIDTEVMAFALQLPVPWKIHHAGNGRLVEKYILREAFRDLLPEKIYRREKLRFSAGTGTDGFMDRVAEEKVEEKGLDGTSRTTEAGYPLNSPKELWYYRLFREAFRSPAFERLVGRWDPGK